MKTLTVRLSEPTFAEIERESQARRISKSDVVRERLQGVPPRAKDRRGDAVALIADLVGSIDGLPADLSSHTKRHLRARAYGKNRPR